MSAELQYVFADDADEFAYARRLAAADPEAYREWLDAMWDREFMLAPPA